jgi:nucleoside-diphosphate-sugar epimerase
LTGRNGGHRIEAVGGILVTGSGGFIGRALTAALGGGTELYQITDRRDLDLRNADATKRRLAEIKPQVIIHLAASPDAGDDPSRDLFADVHNTIACTANLLQAIPDDQRCLMIHVGSYKQYGSAALPFREDVPAQPVTAYGRAKHTAEWLVRLASSSCSWLRTVCLRLGPVYGPGQDEGRLIPKTIRCFLDGRMDGLVVSDVGWDPIYISDAVAGILACVRHPSLDDCVINLSGGRRHSTGAIVELIAAELGLDATPPVVCRDGDQGWECVGDVTRAATLLQWRSEVAVADGVRRMIQDIASRSANGR